MQSIILSIINISLVMHISYIFIPVYVYLCICRYYKPWVASNSVAGVLFFSQERVPGFVVDITNFWRPPVLPQAPFFPPKTRSSICCTYYKLLVASSSATGAFFSTKNTFLDFVYILQAFGVTEGEGDGGGSGGGTTLQHRPTPDPTRAQGQHISFRGTPSLWYWIFYITYVECHGDLVCLLFVQNSNNFHTNFVHTLYTLTETSYTLRPNFVQTSHKLVNFVQTPYKLRNRGYNRGSSGWSLIFWPEPRLLAGASSSGRSLFFWPEPRLLAGASSSGRSLVFIRWLDFH